MISFGTDFVAGRKRVPKPATGKMAFVSFFRIPRILDKQPQQAVHIFYAHYHPFG
jgi:hypothetical protein